MDSALTRHKRWRCTWDKPGAGNGRYYWFWSGQDDNGNAVGTNLYLFAEHVGTTHVSTPGGPSKPYIDPQIREKKIPRKVPTPSAVIRKHKPSLTLRK